MAKQQKDGDGPSYDTSEGVQPDREQETVNSFLGFRSLWFDPKLGKLRSPQQRHTIWEPGMDQHATCRSDHEPANHGCHCGIYAGGDVLTAAPYTQVGNIFILVHGWGEVQPAASGWRAQFARIAAVFKIAAEVSLPASQLRRISKRYGVPLIEDHSADVEDYRLLLRYGGLSLDEELAQLTKEEGDGK